MDALIDLIIQQHPGFAAEIEGCTEEEIARFEEVCPVPMPDDYKDFLRRMGKRQGRVMVYCRPAAERTGSGNYRVSIDYATVYGDYLARFKEAARRGQAKPEKSPVVLTGDLSEFREDPANYFYFGYNHLGNDNGNLFLDVRSPDLPVVEIDWYTRGIVPIAPSLVEYLFSDDFRREVSTYLHNRQWMRL
jgi:hypothetical protein